MTTFITVILYIIAISYFLQAGIKTSEGKGGYVLANLVLGGLTLWASIWATINL